jgi:broad specificity phosphatase PhoE
MQPVRIAFIRHSKSCANHLRSINDGLSDVSQKLRDASLSAVGKQMAQKYSPVLHRKLRDLGFTLDKNTVVGSSQLRRARHTAALLFPGRRREVYPYFTEYGNVPENTPEGRRYQEPSWAPFINHIHKNYSSTEEFVIVGHGYFLRAIVWPFVTGRAYGEGGFKNLDGFVVFGHFTDNGVLIVSSVQTIPYTGSVNPDTTPDMCTLPTKIATMTREKMLPCHKTRKAARKTRRRQHGGAYNMPLAYFQNGAQFHGTSATPTGTGLTGMTGSWARAPLAQTGGGCQDGGFSPSIMGSFAANGLQYAAPIATYTGYKMFRSRGSRRSTRRSGRA